MRVALALAVTAVLGAATTAEARELRRGRTEPVRLGVDAAEPGVGRCTSDGVCSFTREDGATFRGAGTLGATGDVRAARRAKVRRPAIPTA